MESKKTSGWPHSSRMAMSRGSIKFLRIPSWSCCPHIFTACLSINNDYCLGLVIGRGEFWLYKRGHRAAARYSWAEYSWRLMPSLLRVSSKLMPHFAMQDGRFERLVVEDTFGDDPFGNTPAPQDSDEESPGMSSSHSKWFTWHEENLLISDAFKNQICRQHER